MALGGGNFTSQNKILPGAYINVISAARASATLSDRGVVALPIALDWGKQDEVFTLTSEDFQKNSLKLLGYDYSAPEVMPLREIFLNAVKVHVYNLNSGGVKATSALATAKYAGVRGNALKYVISANIDDESKKDVALYLGTTKIDSQTVANASDLVDNDFVTYNKEATLTETAGTSLTGGTNGSELTGASYQAALDKLEAHHNFNALVCPTTEASTIALFVAFTKRMRDQVGVKFQTVVYRTLADYEGIVSVENSVNGADEYAAIYWVAGAIGGCAINKSNTNKKYDGELDIDCKHTQSELEAGILAGKFMFHKVEDVIRVLMDINTFVSHTPEKGEIFSNNQVVRVADQRANDTGSIFNTNYLGKVQNDKSGRVSYWNELVSHARQMERIRAIETYDADSLTVEQGEKKTSVVVNEVITVIGTMEKLYMTTVVN